LGDIFRDDWCDFHKSRCGCDAHLNKSNFEFLPPQNIYNIDKKTLRRHDEAVKKLCLAAYELLKN
jgi:hypothetical protein